MQSILRGIFIRANTRKTSYDSINLVFRDDFNIFYVSNNKKTFLRDKKLIEFIEKAEIIE